MAVPGQPPVPRGRHFHVKAATWCFEPLPKLEPRADDIYRVNVRGPWRPADVASVLRIKADGLTDPVRVKRARRCTAMRLR